MERLANLDSLVVILAAEDRRFAARVAGHASQNRIQVRDGQNSAFGETVMTTQGPADKLFILCSSGNFVINGVFDWNFGRTHFLNVKSMPFSEALNILFTCFESIRRVC